MSAAALQRKRVRDGIVHFRKNSEIAADIPAELRRVSLRRAIELYDALIRAEDDLASNVSANAALTALIAGM